jgi:hypothetical protein
MSKFFFSLRDSSDLMDQETEKLSILKKQFEKFEKQTQELREKFPSYLFSKPGEDSLLPSPS